MPDGWYMTDDGYLFGCAAVSLWAAAPGEALPVFVTVASAWNDRLTLEAAYARGPHKSMFGGTP